MAAYLEGEDAFKETCLQFCNLVFPQQNTLALLLPLLFGNKEHQLKDVNLQGWPRLLSGILAIMPSDAATPLIKDLAETLRSQNRVIPSQICSILCGDFQQKIIQHRCLCGPQFRVIDFQNKLCFPIQHTFGALQCRSVF